MIPNQSATSHKQSHRALLARLKAPEAGFLIALLLGAGLILVFGWLADEVVEGDTRSFDQQLLMLFRNPGMPIDLLGPPWFEEMVRDVTALGSYAIILMLVAAAVGFLMLVRKRALALLVLGAEVGGMLLSNLLKTSFDRPRPELEHAARVFTASFPSGHATLSAVTFLTLGALLARAAAAPALKVYFMTLAVLLTLIVGLSRVYLGVHYPTDVLAGWCIGAGWAALCWGAALWLQRRGTVEAPSDAQITDT